MTTRNVGLKMDSDLVNRLDEVADYYGHSRSALVHFLVRRFVEAWESDRRPVYPPVFFREEHGPTLEK